MEAGDQNVAFISLCCTNVHGFMAGVPLAALKADADLVMGLLRQYQQDQVLCIFGPWREMIMDLSSSKSAGELQWRDEAFVEARKKSVHSFAALWTYMGRLHTSYFVGDMRLADACRKVSLWQRKLDFSFSAMTMRPFMSCLIAVAIYRETGSRRHRKDAVNELKLMRTFVKWGGINIIQRLQLMEAEFASLSETKNEGFTQTKALYDKAIKSASRSGYLSDAALANELCGEFCARHRDMEWAKHYISRSFELYKTWGCAVKLNLLSEKWGSLIAVSDSHQASLSSFKIRFDLFSTRQDLERNFSRRTTKSEKIDPSSPHKASTHSQQFTSSSQTFTGSSMFTSIEEKINEE